MFCKSKERGILLNGPVHERVCHKERWGDIEDLVTETTEGVEDGGVPEVGEQALAVGREGVCGDALLSSGD